MPGRGSCGNPNSRRCSAQLSGMCLYRFLLVSLDPHGAFVDLGTVLNGSLFKELVSCDRVLCVSLRVVDAGVLLEVLLRNSVEGERGNRTLQARSCHTPCAAGAAPSAEVVAVDPDQVFVHAFAFPRVLELELGLRWVVHRASQSHPSPWVISHGITERH